MPFFDPIRIGAAGAADTAFTVDRSLRFNSGDSPSLTRTPSSTTNRRTYTFSFWFKLNNTGTNYLFEVGDSDANDNRLYIRIASDSAISIGERDVYRFITNQKIRDFSAWYHLVFAVDTTLSTADNRMRLYLNGEEITSFSTRNNFSQNQDTGVNRNHITNWGRSDIDSHYAGVYLSEINFIDGYQYDPSYFGETNAETGQWNPKLYTGSYGTNGYYLNFSNNSTTQNLGLDQSGNGNNFSVNGMGSVLYHALPDTPTNNFSTFNRLFPYTNGASFDEGNLRVTFGGSGNGFVPSTFALQSGKWYAECLPEYIGNGVGVGIGGRSINVNDWSTGTDVIAIDNEGNVVTNSSNSYPSTPPSSSYTTSDVIGVALDITAGTVTFYKNNSQIYQANLSNLSTGGNSDSIYFFVFADGSSATSARGVYNFGQDSTFRGNKTKQGNTDGNGIGDFVYSPPSGHLAVCSANLPEPTILLPNKHFDTVLYTGNNYSGTRAITGYNFQPDWIWTKNRTTATSHHLYDEVRGLGSGKEICTDKDQVEGGENGAAYGYMTRYGVGGFNTNAGTDGSNPNYNLNRNGDSYVAWAWNAGDTDGKTYTVTVVDDSGNKFRFDGFGTSAVTLDLAEGGTYIFNYPSGHPFRFSTTSDGTHGGGSEYTTGVTHNSSTQVTIVVAASAPTLYYYCSSHSGMGGQVNTNSTLGSSNFEGNTQATVKVNATAGFSIISWNARGTSSGTYDTLGHGLGVRPNWLILKSRNNTGNWNVYFSNFGSQAYNKILQLSNTIAETTSSNYWGADNTTPSSTLIHLNQGNYSNSASPPKFIMYAFSEVAGYSKFGSYSGSGSGTFVFLGFRPAFVMIKRVNATDHWNITDNKRGDFNVIDEAVYANLSSAEDSGSYNQIDYLSNGFVYQGDNSQASQSGGEFIYFAFAEAPFKNARAR